MAVLPADDPEILVYVMLDDPNNVNSDYSSVLAAPVVGNIISEIAPYLGIATDGIDRSGTTVKVPQSGGHRVEQRPGVPEHPGPGPPSGGEHHRQHRRPGHLAVSHGGHHRAQRHHRLSVHGGLRADRPPKCPI